MTHLEKATDKTDVALRELLMSRIGEMAAQNEMRDQLVDSMRGDAIVFAQAMQDAGLPSDQAKIGERITTPKALFRDAVTEAVFQPIWIISRKSRYGGGELDIRDSVSRYGRKNIRRLAIDQAGQIVIVSWLNPHSTIPYMNDTAGPITGTNLMNFDAVSSPETARDVMNEWIQDLEAMALSYSKEPFEPTSITGQPY